MAEKNEKLLSPEAFMENVYKNVGLLESMDETAMRRSLEIGNKGCFGIFVAPFMDGIAKKATKLARKEMKLDDLSIKAEELLSRKEMKGLLCKHLDASVNLPIDAAYKLTPVLYKLALENDKNVPFDSMLFAIICRKITNQGVHNYCG